MSKKWFDGINWKVRIKNKVFWLTLIPAIILLIQEIASLFGIVIDLSAISANLIDVVEALFVILSIIGIVTDPTTTGITDSERALTYDKPNE